MFHYFIAIVLPDSINEKVLAYKQYMSEHYGCWVGLKSPAHITLVPPFWTGEENEEQLISDLTKLALHPEFQLGTLGFAAFVPRTIFIQPSSSEQLNELRKKADEIFCSPGGFGKKEDRAFHPHITIATRDLSKKSFVEAWEYFKQKNFKAEWMVRDVSLLKHNGGNWEVIRTIPFRF